jgi:transcriptional regulator with XRE-family HTH domain
MSAANLSLANRAESAATTSARQQLLQSFRDPEYRHLFVNERLRASVALQIRALRQMREMTQKSLGDAIGMAQTWVSILENPEYGKMTVATLLRLAEAFDTDLEIKFRPFSRTLDTIPTQGPDYFAVPSFQEEFGASPLAPEDMEKVRNIEERLQPSPAMESVLSHMTEPSERSSRTLEQQQGPATRKSVASANYAAQEQYGTHQSAVSQINMAL